MVEPPEDYRTLISLKPAWLNLSFALLTAWYGVGEAFTKDRKSIAAACVLTGAMVEYLLRVGKEWKNVMKARLDCMCWYPRKRVSTLLCCYVKNERISWSKIRDLGPRPDFYE